MALPNRRSIERFNGFWDWHWLTHAISLHYLYIFSSFRHEDSDLKRFKDAQRYIILPEAITEIYKQNLQDGAGPTPESMQLPLQSDEEILQGVMFQMPTCSYQWRRFHRWGGRRWTKQFFGGWFTHHTYE